MLTRIGEEWPSSEKNADIVHGCQQQIYPKSECIERANLQALPLEGLVIVFQAIFAVLQVTIK